MSEDQNPIDYLWNDPFGSLVTASGQSLIRSTLGRTASPEQSTTDSMTIIATDHEGFDRVPHQGALCRIDLAAGPTSPLSYHYMIDISLENGETHELLFDRRDFEFMSRIYAILDTDSRGFVGRSALQEFVTLRCPVFWRRDDDLRKVEGNVDEDSCTSPTFDEVWAAVAKCSKLTSSAKTSLANVKLGVEGWMVFCRFITLAQYLEAKRRFSARHLQQTMRHRNSPRGSEVVVIDVPPPAPPTSISPLRLADHERKGKAPLPLPELDLDHSLITAHDISRRRSSACEHSGTVKIALFGARATSSKGMSSSSSSNLEFAVSYSPKRAVGDEMIVRRSLSDLKWLNQTIQSHKGIGGTLCGRILPPFPGQSTNTLASQFQPDEHTIQTAIDGTGAAMKAAAAGVGIIKNAAKSLWGSYIITSSNTSMKVEKSDTGTSSAGQKKKSFSRSVAIPESYYNPNSPNGKARHLERYLNYLLEHPALSTSFPLNTILKASQSGLEAAKIFLADHATLAKSLKAHTPQAVDGKSSLPFWSHQSSYSEYGQHPNLSWVRTAAQAALALKVHGLLETTGLPSASARLQHASLPSFDNAGRNVGWSDEESAQAKAAPAELSADDNAESFEHGVVQVESELADNVTSEDDGYDMLPLPIPAPERRILCAGSSTLTSNQADGGALLSPSFRDQASRFHYGNGQGDHIHSSDQSEVESAFLGDFSVDDNIDKLREVIGSVDNTLSRCLSAIALIGEAREERLGYHLELVQGFDSWEGLKGKFVSQRALLKGVSGLEQSKEVFEESDLEMIDDLSWQASLASSAVSAAEDVRSTVRAARTAANAKAAADAAAFTAQSACEGERFPSIDEARAAHTRSSIAQSHAIHAAVVEHEATTAKRRAALGLAHDVKCWNVHRKRELLRSCISHARSQHVATRRAVDSWSCLRDGYLGSTIIPCTDTRVNRAPTESTSVPPKTQHEVEDDEVHVKVYSEIAPGMASALSSQTIEAIDHMALAAKATKAEQIETTDVWVEKFSSPSILNEILPFVDAAPIPEEGPDLSSSISPDDEENVQLTESMQSLVNGLMAWGGQFDSDEDFSLPPGMATSIVMEHNEFEQN